MRRGLMAIKERADELGLKTSSDPIQPGDTYLAERNTGPVILVCAKVVNNEFGKPSYIVPNTLAYPFDVCECIKIVEE